MTNDTVTRQSHPLPHRGGMTINALFAAQDQARTASADDLERLGERLAALDQLISALRDDGSLEGMTNTLAAQLGTDPVTNKLLIGLALNVAMISAQQGDVPVPNQV